MSEAEKSCIPTLAGGVFLAGLFWRLYAGMCIAGSGAEAVSMMGSRLAILAEILLCIGLFLRQKGVLLRAGLALLVLQQLLSVSSNLRPLTPGRLPYVFLALAQLLASLLMLLLTFSAHAAGLQRRWMWPGFLLGAALAFTVLYLKFVRNDDGPMLLGTLTFRCYGYLLIGYWYAHPEMSLFGLFHRYARLEEVQTRSDAYLWSVRRCLAACAALLLVAIPTITPSSHAFFFPLVGLVFPWTIGPLILLVTVAPKVHSHTRQRDRRRSGNEIVKHAVIGGMLAGNAGAIVGAISGKARQDSVSDIPEGTLLDGQYGASAGDEARGEVIRSGIIGGLIGGDVGAVIGAAAAKARQDTSSDE